MTSRKSRVGVLSLFDKVEIIVGVLILVVIRIPLYLASLVVLHGRTNGLIRLVGLQAVRYITQYSTAQMQWLLAPTRTTFDLWTKLSSITSHPPEVLVDGAKLYWIGPKRTDKVVLYVPGGGFIAPIQLNFIHFWNYVREKLGEKGIDAAFAFLDYGLLPDAEFPTQLRQLSVAVDHLLACGLEPNNLHIVGDSAGANLILQFLSHLLHPLEVESEIGPALLPSINSSTPPDSSSLDRRLGSVYLMSPWVTFESSTESFTNPQSQDVFPIPNGLFWGRQYSFGVPLSQMPYIVPLAAAQSPSWFAGLSRVVKCVLISAGEEERFRDDVITFAERLKKHARDAELYLEVQEGGLHDDPYYDFLAGGNPSQVGTLTPVIIDWLRAKLE